MMDVKKKSKSVIDIGEKKKRINEVSTISTNNHINDSTISILSGYAERCKK